MASGSKQQQISMAASIMALKGVRLFLKKGKAAAQRRASPPKQKEKKPKSKNKKIIHRLIENLIKVTRFNKNELEDLYTMYRKLVAAAQLAAPPSPVGQPPTKIERLSLGSSRKDEADDGASSPRRCLFTRTLKRFGLYELGKDADREFQSLAGIDQNTFRDVMHNSFHLVTEEAILERLWVTWERGANGGEGALKFEAWAKGLSVLLKGTNEERQTFCFRVYDLNADGYITRDEMFILLKNSLLKQPGDEDPDEGVRDLVELVLRKLDVDKDGRVSLDDYREAVRREPLLLEAFGECLPSRRQAAEFMKSLIAK